VAFSAVKWLLWLLIFATIPYLIFIHITLRGGVKRNK